jgi:hypothetical protein
LYFHHAWTNRDQHARSPFSLIKEHVLLKFASMIEEVDAEIAARLSVEKIAAIVELIPEEWLAEDPGFDSRSQQRQAYLNYFKVRLASSKVFVQEAIHARAAHV